MSHRAWSRFHICPWPTIDRAAPYNLIVYNCNFKNKAASWHKSRTQTHTSLWSGSTVYSTELYFRCAHCLRENKANLNSYWPSSGRILCWQSNTGLLTLWCSYFCCGTIRGDHIVYTEPEVGKHAREHVCVCFQVPVLSLAA